MHKKTIITWASILDNNRLIAYNILKDHIISNKYCTGCGACVATCPVGALELEGDKAKRAFDCSQNLDLCPICNEICPHSQALLLRSMEIVADAPIRSEAAGYIRSILLSQSNDPKIRENSVDGAVATSLLMYGLDTGVFDCAVVTGSEEGVPAKPKSKVALTSKEVAEAMGSKFFTAPIVKTYGSAVQEYGKEKIAVVGLPCQVLALRKIDAWKHKISCKSKLVIGLFCFGAFSIKPFLNYIQKKFSLSLADIDKITYAHDLTLHINKGKIEIPQPQAKELIHLGCKTCTDYTSELADISVGSAYPMRDWSMVIIRTKAGEDFFNSAVEAGVINVRDTQKEPEVFERVIIAALQKRTSGLLKISKLEKTRDFVPVRLLRETESLQDVKVEDIMTKEVNTILSSMTVSDLLTIMATETYIGYPVVNEEGELLGVVTMEEVANVDKASRWKTTVGSIARHNIDVCYPGETALDALKKMSRQETGRIIVLDPTNPKKMLGIITKRDIMHTMVEQASESIR